MRVDRRISCARLLTLEEAQSRLPGQPSLRWIAREAKKLGCYRRIGTACFIPVAAWDHFVSGRPWIEHVSVGFPKGPAPSPASQAGDAGQRRELEEAIALARAGKRRRGVKGVRH